MGHEVVDVEPLEVRSVAVFDFVSVNQLFFEGRAARVEGLFFLDDAIDGVYCVEPEACLSLVFVWRYDQLVFGIWRHVWIS